MAFSVIVAEPGPLYVRLEYGHDGLLRVNGWDPTPHGGPGPVEITNVVRTGDALVAVNRISLSGFSLKASVKLIKQATVPRTLTFRRPGNNTCFISEGISDLGCVSDVLATDVINKSKLREVASRGLSESSPLRPLVWRLLLEYLPPDRREWVSHVRCQRALYHQFVREFTNCESGHSIWAQADHEVASRASVVMDIYQGPMTTHQSSMWTQKQHDYVLRKEIHKDIMRTHPDHHFFEGGTLRRQSMERILFIYAKLNPGVRYVQGMNEVLGTIFYVLASDSNEEWGANAEPDAFFCFTNIMAEMRDVYIHSLDNSDAGLSGKMSRLNALLQQHDPELWRHLDKNQLDPSYYSLRWITTLLAREFTLIDTIRLWDTILSEISRVDFLCHFCVTMILAQRETLLAGDFSFCLYLLQNYPASDPNVLLKQTHILQRPNANDYRLISNTWWT